METIFKNPKLKSQNGRNAFDRSQHRVWHSPFGALLPCFCKRVNPDDYVELSIESQTICDKLIRPAFIRLKEHINWYFVPDNMLWMPFDNFITGQDNYFSIAAQNIQETGTPNSVPMFNSGFLANMFAYLSSRVDVNGFSKLDGGLRLLDLLGYGNYYPMCQSIESGGGAITAQDAAAALAGLEPMNFFALLAYQKVYYDYYRNPKYEENLTKAFNIDDIKGTTVLDGTNTSLLARFADTFTMHYAWAKKDYFTDVQPSVLPTTDNIGFSGLNSSAPTNYNVWSIFGLPGTSRTGVITSVSNSSDPTVNYDQHFGERVSLAGATSLDKLPSSYSQTNVLSNVQTNVSALRFAFAYDKLMRRMREAGGTFDAQMLAQFGIVPYDQRHGKCIYLGGQTNRLNASDVTDVANNLGYLGGQLNCYNPARTTSKYHVKDHGIIIGIYNTSLDFDYPSYGIERDNLAKYRFDWFNPAFENMGLQPTFRMELLNIDQNTTTSDWDPENVQHDPSLRDILGYSIRYQEYKTSVDRVYGLYDFGSGDINRQAWVAQYFPFKHKLTSTTGTEGKLIAPFTKSNMVLSPLMFNQVTSVDDDSGWLTDPFEHNQYIHFKCISNMSSLGEVF